jgi:hypothetical protein
MELLVVIWVICGIVGAVMSEKRGRSRFGGFVLGLLLGVIGIAIVVLMGHAKAEPDGMAAVREYRPFEQ